VLNVVPGYNSVRARVPLDQLEAIARHPQVVFIQPKQEGSNAAGRRTARPSTCTSFEQRASRVRDYLTTVLSKTNPLQLRVVPLEGYESQSCTARDVRVNGSGGRLAFCQTGSQPLHEPGTGNVGQVTVLPGQAGAGDEGTAMLEIVHDLAPVPSSTLRRRFPRLPSSHRTFAASPLDATSSSMISSSSLRLHFRTDRPQASRPPPMAVWSSKLSTR
jgi:hypothetical protein